MSPQLPQAHFGKVGAPKADWRKMSRPEDDVDDDSELDRTPEHVIRMLGFDPKSPGASLAPPSAPPQPQGGGNPYMAGPAPTGQTGAQGAPGPAQGPAPSPPTPEQIAQARAHITPVVEGLVSLVSRPRGDLTKKNVFDAASEMIAKGGFPTAESKQGLIAELAKLPDDEMQLRQALEALLIQTAGNRAKFLQVHGAG